MEAPGKAVASTVTTGLGQAVGVLPKPMGDPGAPFGSQPFQEYYARSSMAFDQARQDIFGFNSDPTPYQGFVANNAVMGDPQGSFLGTAFWQDQLKARLG